MNSTQTPTFFKWTFHQPPAKMLLERQQSLQFDPLSPQFTPDHVRSNPFSSYRVFQNKNQRFLDTIMPEANETSDVKTSMFLKNYNQKLKRQRKRQSKLKSSLRNLNPLTTRQGESITKSSRISDNHKQLLSKNPLNSPSNTIQHNSTSQILVFKKSTFIDTSSNHFKKNKKDYANDSTLQLLLKEIYEIKKEEKKQIQKMRLKMLTIDTERKQKRDMSLESYLSKYDRGFSLPSRRRFTFGDKITSRLSEVEEERQTPEFKHLQQKIPTKRSNENRRKKLQKVYNFKTIDPWQSPNTRQHHHSNETGYFLQKLQQFS